MLSKAYSSEGTVAKDTIHKAVKTTAVTVFLLQQQQNPSNTEWCSVDLDEDLNGVT